MNSLRTMLTLAIYPACLLFGLLATAGPAKANDNIRPSIDVAQFKDAQDNSYIEIYYSIPESGITYKSNDAGVLGCQLVVDIEIHLKKQLWANKMWKIERTIEDTSAVSESNHVVDVIRYFIAEPGEYDITMHIKDMQQADHIDSARTTFTASTFATGRVDISGVELATHIERIAPGTQGALIKNSYNVTPNPAGIYGEGSAGIYYYFEAYNLTSGLDTEQYKSVCKVLDANDREIEGLGMTYRSKRRVYDTSIEIGKLNIANLPSGKYTFVYGLADSGKTMLASKQKLFYVYNPHVQVADTFGEGKFGPLDALTEDDLDKEFKILIHINTKIDRDMYKSLKGAEGKREFIYAIWSRANEDNLPALAFREQYLGRAKYADDKFKSVFHKGWKSDRGRVFVLYGIPSNIERFPSTERTMPYEIWIFHKLRGQSAVEFIFGDESGFNKYELLHSDLRGERRNTEWQRDLARGSNERNFR